MYWCFHCYGVNPQPTGACEHCGLPIEGPDGLAETDLLVWALRHPDGDRAVLAARRLGQMHAHAAIPALSQAIDDGTDPYVAAVALEALIEIEGVAALRERLMSIASTGPLLLQRVARSALRRSAD